MKNLLLILTASATLALHACSDDPDGVDNPTYPPVETNDPNTNYQPAFQGQTRAAGVRTTTKLDTTIITSGLTSPWGVRYLPDGKLLVTQKGGSMRIIGLTGTIGAPLTGLPAVNATGQGGLLGLALDPSFASNRMVYWSFSENVSGGTVTSIAKGRLSVDEKAIENATVIYRAIPAYNGNMHYGSRIAFDAQGNLFVTTGERSDLATRPLAQSISAALGKVLHITKDGQPAPGNPSFGAEALPVLYTIGHRNPQGLAIHPATGELWLAEHGPRGGDEINHIQAGKNYGWPVITYGIEYSGQKVGDGIQQKEGLEQPVYYWDPVVSPSGMTFYSGKRVPEWENNLFIGALSGMHIVRLVIENNKVVGEERLLSSENQRFRDITQGADGALYAITDQGRLYKLDKAN